jgi:hypothetical protein
MPGWRAIESALADAFPDAPFAVFRRPDGGTFETYPLAAVFAHQLEDAWHYAGIGLGEIERKQAPDPAVSGWGVEHTFRLPRGPEANPPAWPVILLHRLAAHVWQRRRVLAEYHHLLSWGPLIEESSLTQLLFVPDPSFPEPITTSFGTICMVQAVGITADEGALITEWSTRGLADELREVSPSYTFAPTRSSLLDDPARAPAIRARAAREGSELSAIVPETLSFHEEGGRFVVRLGPADMAAEGLPSFLRGRTRLGRPFTLRGREQSVELRGGTESGTSLEGDTLVVTLDGKTREALEAGIASAPLGEAWSFPGLPFALVLVE